MRDVRTEWRRLRQRTRRSDQVRHGLRSHTVERDVIDHDVMELKQDEPPLAMRVRGHAQTQQRRAPNVDFLRFRAQPLRDLSVRIDLWIEHAFLDWKRGMPIDD